MTKEEMIRFVEYQARTMAHLHGLAVAKPWMDFQDAVKAMIEDNEAFRQNLEYCQKIHGTCQKELREKE